ncbi:MAG: HAD family phosphatase [Anaerolineales bacterium]|nr:HAD family phosphatase [Anaerolineales bacterium]
MDFELLLFDLGGVLVEISDNPIPPEWLPDEARFTLAAWFSSPAARAFEMGQISAREFAGALRQELHLKQSPQTIIDHFARWPKGLFPQAPPLLSRLQAHYRLAVLTNSNELHWPRILNEFDLPRYFNKLYSSHLIHLAKPDPAIFRYVLADLGLAPEQVLFFDDNPANIAGAEMIGIRSVETKGPDDLESYITHQGLIDI